MIRLINARKNFGRQTLYDGVDASIVRGERIGLLGKNGAGQVDAVQGPDGPSTTSTAASCSATGRSRSATSRRRSTRSSTARSSRTCWPTSAPGPRPTASSRRSWPAWRRATPRRSTDYDDAMEAFLTAGGYEMESRAKAILLGLGFSVASLDAPVATLSGGWAMRLALGGLLAFEHDLLLLDEPTNHLDLLSVKWFEDFLRSYPGAILITCHDRDFLDRVINKTFELEMGKLHMYSGNYSAYLPQKDHRISIQQAAFDGQQKKIKEMQDFVDRNKARASTASRAQSRLKAIEKIDRVDAPQTDTSTMRIKLPEPPRSGQVVAKLDDVGFAYGTKVVYSRLDLEIQRGDRVVLVGPNGAGKTTLMKLLAGVLKPTRGEVALGSNVFATYFAQHRVEALDMKSTVLGQPPRGPPRPARRQPPGDARRLPLRRRRRRQAGLGPLRRREDPALPGQDPHRRPQLHHDGRADQPPRHRQPRRPGRGPDRLPGLALLHLPRRALHPGRRHQGDRGRLGQAHRLPLRLRELPLHQVEGRGRPGRLAVAPGQGRQEARDRPHDLLHPLDRPGQGPGVQEGGQGLGLILDREGRNGGRVIGVGLGAGGF